MKGGGNKQIDRHTSASPTQEKGGKGLPLETSILSRRETKEFSFCVDVVKSPEAHKIHFLPRRPTQEPFPSSEFAEKTQLLLSICKNIVLAFKIWRKVGCENNSGNASVPFFEICSRVGISGEKEGPPAAQK